MRTTQASAFFRVLAEGYTRGSVFEIDELTSRARQRKFERVRHSVVERYIRFCNEPNHRFFRVGFRFEALGHCHYRVTRTPRSRWLAQML